MQCSKSFGKLIMPLPWSAAAVVAAVVLAEMYVNQYCLPASLMTECVTGTKLALGGCLINSYRLCDPRGSKLMAIHSKGEVFASLNGQWRQRWATV